MQIEQLPLPWREVRHLPSTGSTNADLAALARGGELPGLVLVADEQTAGRGRLDRSWVSPAGGSVAVSVLVEPQPAFPQWGWLSLLAGLAVADTIAGLAPNPDVVELKWPNDVLVRGRKVCGILSERIDPPGGAAPLAVLGMGINLDIAAEHLPVPTATSLALEGIETNRDTVVAVLLTHLGKYLETWQGRGELADEYGRRCASIGAELEIVVDAATRAHGTGHGVDEHGRLQVATARGLETFAVGDVVHARLA